ncbi:MULTISPECIES: hypothetical protein [unclassified Paenibacillus]|uniref:hypothetical protein n=1 Tax=unclassified Paenibacillus TaxID=185978 RepID=UPI003631A64D
MHKLWSIQRNKDSSVFILSLFILVTFLYESSIRSEYMKEREFIYQKYHEKAYSSLYLFTERLQTLYRQVLIKLEATGYDYRIA